MLALVSTGRILPIGNRNQPELSKAAEFIVTEWGPLLTLALGLLRMTPSAVSIPNFNCWPGESD